MPRSTPPGSEQNILLRPRIRIGDAITFGSGKIDLLRKIGEMQSISAAARSLGLPYKRAWLLIGSLNRGFGHPVIETSAGGKGGGGAQLTPLGEQLIARYDALEASLTLRAAKELQALRDLAA